jgi:hypothetical protein
LSGEESMQGGIGSKLVLSFLGIALIGLIGGAFGYYGLSSSEKAIRLTRSLSSSPLLRCAGGISGAGGC